MSEEPKKRTRKPKPQYELICDQLEYLKGIGCDVTWLDVLHKQYGFDRFEYLHKFRAFRCHKDGRHVDWIDVNDLALLNGKRKLELIMLRHQPVNPKKAVINLPWR